MNKKSAEAINNISESRLQSNCFIWAYNTFPQIRGLLFSVPNGGTRNIREAQVLRATGLTSGIPDMLLLYRGIHAFEFKSKKGIISPQQEKIHLIWRKNEIPVHIIRDEETFIYHIKKALFERTY